MNLQGLNMKRFLAVACLSSLSVIAHAVDSTSGVYLGGEFGRTQVDNLPSSGDKDSFGVFLGYSFGNKFSVELGYRDLFDANWVFSWAEVDRISKIDVTAIQLAGQYQFSITDAFGISARAGVAHVESELKVTSMAYEWADLGPQATRSHTDKTSDTVIFAGVGAQYRINAITLRATYDIYDDANNMEFDVFAIGAAWNF